MNTSTSNKGEGFAPQVPSDSYDFAKYMTQRRWTSLWHQVRLIDSLKPTSVLEVGVGDSLLRTICKQFGVHFTTVDIDPALNPEIVASVSELPIESKSFDLTCAFQVLEHLPYQDALQGFQELCRVSRRDVLISLPNAARAYPLEFPISTFRRLRIFLPGPAWPYSKMIKSHYWELQRPGTSTKQVIRDFEKSATLIETFHVFQNPYHQFFHFRCKNHSRQ